MQIDEGVGDAGDRGLDVRCDISGPLGCAGAAGAGAGRSAARMRSAADRGSAVLVATHDEAVADAADRVIKLDVSG